MKRNHIACMLALTCMVGALSGCTKEAATPMAIRYQKEAVYPEGIAADDYEKQRKNQEENELNEEFIESLAQFSYKTGTKILSGQEGNAVYSPVSLYMALAAAAAGTDEETKNEMYGLLEISGKDKEYLLDQTGKLYRLLYSDNEAGMLRIANALWIQDGFPVSEKYVNELTKKLYASIFQVDFTDELTKDIMSDWVYKATKELIKPEITITPNQVMTIMNTIYFSDIWKDKFDKENTKEDTFTLEDGTTVSCDFMNQYFYNHEYREGDGFASTYLRFVNNGSMLFILPDEGTDLNSLLSDPEKMKDMLDLSKFHNAEIDFKMPKFDNSSSIDLKAALQGLGMKDAFSKNADFSGISNEPLFISAIKQDARFIADEEGVKAAAYTEISFETTGALVEGTKVNFHLNRPFIYAVVSDDGTVIFMGVCKNPTKL
ncbi:MAG: serpin family protein [Lachnospiraceae bacterium]|nr:serpin family protein [Lachnospiraceae bacterium]